MLILPVPSFIFFRLKGVYDPKAFILHAASLCQGFPHCTRFLAAASRRSLVRVPVPVWLVVLSNQLPVIALVSLYLTNKLIGVEPLPSRLTALPNKTAVPFGLFGISQAFAWLSPARGYVTQLLLTRAPLYLPLRAFAYDLHALSTPPAFILSQDQTLRLIETCYVRTRIFTKL